MNKMKKVYIVVVVLAVGYILFSMFSNRKVMGIPDPAKETIE